MGGGRTAVDVGPYAVRMSLEPLPPGSVRPSAVVNAEIRALVIGCGGWLYGAAQVRYQVLVEEWAAAVAVERVEVAEVA